jgi:hypothetical protein
LKDVEIVIIPDINESIIGVGQYLRGRRIMGNWVTIDER